MTKSYEESRIVMALSKARYYRVFKKGVSLGFVNSRGIIRYFTNIKDSLKSKVKACVAFEEQTNILRCFLFATLLNKYMSK